MKHTTLKRRSATPAGAFLRGSAICIFSFLAVILLSAMLVSATKNPLADRDRYSPLIFALAGAMAGFLGQKCGGGRLFLFCPPLFVLFGLLLGLFLSGGRISPSALLSETIYLGAAYLAFYLAKQKGTRKRKRKY